MKEYPIREDFSSTYKIRIERDDEDDYFNYRSIAHW